MWKKIYIYNYIMISVRSNISKSLQYQKFTPSGCKDIVIREFKFVGYRDYFPDLKQDLS